VKGRPGVPPPSIAYVTSHVGPHPMHRALVKAVDARVERLDHWLRWVDLERPKWQQYLSWVVNGLALPHASDYELIVVEGFQVPAAIMKWSRRLRPTQKIVCHHVGEQLYFLETGFYSPRTDWAMRRILAAYDAHLCVGLEQTRLLQRVLGPAKNIYTTYCTHISQPKWEQFTQLTPSLDSQRILFVGHIYSDWRLHYKGLDLLVRAFGELQSQFPKAALTVVGITTQVFERHFSTMLSPAARAKIEVVEHASDLGPLFETHSLFALPARGDAFPTVVLESLAAGLPALVSVDTGNKEVASEVSPDLVSELNSESLRAALARYLALPAATRVEFSQRARAVASGYTEARGTAAFRDALNSVYGDLGLLRR
jgi:glycosyltransferase involved in cell wall biosynthesis